MLGGTFGQSFYRDICGKQFWFARGTFGKALYRQRVFSCILLSEPTVACSKSHEQCYGCYGMACWRRFGGRAQAPHFIDLPPLP